MTPALRRRLERVLRGRLDPADDTGATMVLALILVTVVAVVVGALLSFGDTSVRVTVAVRSQAATNYAGDGAAQAAITALRRSPFDNDPSSATYPKCFGTTDTLVLPNFYPGTTGGAATSAAVKCSPDPDTGAAGGLVEINQDNKPGNAILTTGRNPAEDGLNIKALNNSVPFLVHGSVVSDSNIRVTNGSLQSNSSVLAHTGCSGTIVSTPPANCAAATVDDPGYSSEAGGVVPPYRTVPTSCPNNLVTFQPGYYDDAQALSSLMNGVGSNPCKGSVWWFTPGIYYFDFHNSSNPLLGGSDVWTVNDGQLVAGTPVNSAGTVISKPTVPATVPGSCQNPLKDDSAVGVQFIFGGDSQFQLNKSADAEICANYHAHARMIAMYGVPDGVEHPDGGTTKLTAVPSRDLATFGTTASVANLANSDTFAASWTKTGNNSQTGSFTVDGYAPPTSVPAGSVLTSATLKVTYQNTGNVTQNTRTVQLIPRSAAGTAGTPITVTLPTNATKTVQTASIDLYGGGTSALATAVHSLGYSGASAGYTIKTSQAGIETVDTIQLVLGYTAPAFRGENVAIPGGNCLATAYPSGCAVLFTPTNYKGAFYVQGTTYAPNAAIDLTLSSITAQVMRFGLIARALWVKETGSISYSGPVIEIPDDSPGFGPGGTVVYLDVYLCAAASTCSTATGRLSLRARVLIYDPSGSPSPPARQMTIQSWSVQR